MMGLVVLEEFRQPRRRRISDSRSGTGPSRMNGKWVARAIWLGPEAFVGESVVVALLFFRGQPQPADLISGLFRRYADAVESVDHFPVGGAAPWAIQVPEQARADGLEGGHQAARGTLHFDAVSAVLVNVGFPIGTTMTSSPLNSLRRIARSASAVQLIRPSSRAAFQAQILDQALEIARDGTKFGGGAGVASRLPNQSFATEQGLDSGHPALRTTVR